MLPSGGSQQPTSVLEEFLPMQPTHGQADITSMGNQPPIHLGSLAGGDELLQEFDSNNYMGLRMLGSHTPEGTSISLRPSQQSSPVTRPAIIASITNTTREQVTMITSSHHFGAVGHHREDILRIQKLEQKVATLETAKYMGENQPGDGTRPKGTKSLNTVNQQPENATPSQSIADSGS